MYANVFNYVNDPRAGLKLFHYFWRSATLIVKWKNCNENHQTKKHRCCGVL